MRHERIARPLSLSPIVDRPDHDWPGGGRLAIHLGVNDEVFDFGGGLGAQLAPSRTEPDAMNYAWRDYGNRVGAWRLFDLFDRLALRTTALLDADVQERCRGLAEACRDRGDEIAAHGGSNAAAQGDMGRPGEERMIRDVTERPASLGVRPAGWLGPWIFQSRHTPDLLAKAGYRYVPDWAHDDQPTRPATAHGGLSVPYIAGDRRLARDPRAKAGGGGRCGDDPLGGRAAAVRMRSIRPMPARPCAAAHITRCSSDV